MKSTNNKVHRIRILYAIFISIIAICLGLFFFDVLQNEDPLFAEKQQVESTSDRISGYGITNLHSNDEVYVGPINIEGTDSGVVAKAHVTRFSAEVYMQPEYKNTKYNNHRMVWVLGIQYFIVLLTIAIVLLAIWTLFSLYRNAKQGKVFQHKNIKWIRLIGILIIVMSLSTDLSIYLERTVALDLLQNTQWAPKVHFTIHFARIFFGILLVFIAELFNVGFDMQEEQDLTI